MTLESYIAELLSYMAFIPAAVLCFFPMKNQLKFSLKTILGTMLLLFATTLPVAAYLTCRFALAANALTLPLLILYFFVYHLTNEAHISKSLSVFCFSCAMMSFVCNFANGFQATFPTSNIYVGNIKSSLFQFGVSTVVTIFLAYPLLTYGSRLIDIFDIYHVWYSTITISAIFLCYNLLISECNYETMYSNHVFLFFWTSLSLLLLLMLLIYVIFYFIAIGMLENTKTEERNRILEMQESQYIAQKKYMEDTLKTRHDFKHTIRTLKSLSLAKDYATIDSYLDEYINSMPENDIIQYCKNNAVNALLNFYMQSAKQQDIRLHWKIDLPETVEISNTDLCSILGNILENAITSCQDLPKEDRFIQLSVITRHDFYLYIVAVNHFNGKRIKKNNRYLSTHKNGNGIGLTSIAVTAEKYGGSAEFSHAGTEFYSNVMIPIRQDRV